MATIDWLLLISGLVLLCLLSGCAGGVSLPPPALFSLDVQASLGPREASHLQESGLVGEPIVPLVRPSCPFVARVSAAGQLTILGATKTEDAFALPRLGWSCVWWSH